MSTKKSAQRTTRVASSNPTTQEPENLLEQTIHLQDSYNKVEHFVEKNKNMVLLATAAIALLIIGYLVASNIWLPSKNHSIQNEMVAAQQYFAKDSFNIALNGDGTNSGFIEIADQAFAGWTPAGNLAKYYAGISYLNMGNFDEAIDYLSGFKGKDKLVGAMALGAMGDAYMEKGEKSTGIGYYKRAANYFKNDFTGPMFLLKAGMASEMENENTDALGMYKQLKELYPEAPQARDADKYIARVEAKIQQ